MVCRRIDRRPSGSLFFVWGVRWWFLLSGWSHICGWNFTGMCLEMKLTNYSPENILLVFSISFYKERSFGRMKKISNRA